MSVFPRFALLMSALLTLSGCKLAIMVSSGGEVISASGLHDCSTRRVCEIEINTDDFTETFTAVPAEGYEFEKWQGGPGFNCPESTDPVCVVTNSGFLALFGESAVMHLASGKIDHLLPIFKWVGIDTDGDGTPDRFDEDDDNDGLLDDDDACPLNPDLGCGVGSFLVADGKIWFQPDLFIEESWSDINAVCPGGVCDGVLAGFNMDGWTWASAADVQSLLGTYGIEDFTGSVSDCDAGDLFFFDGWRKTNGSIGISGTSFDGLTGHIQGNQNSVLAVSPCNAEIITNGLGVLISPRGGWFFQTP